MPYKLINICFFSKKIFDDNTIVIYDSVNNTLLHFIFV